MNLMPNRLATHIERAQAAIKFRARSIRLPRDPLHTHGEAVAELDRLGLLIHQADVAHIQNRTGHTDTDRPIHIVPSSSPMWWADAPDRVHYRGRVDQDDPGAHRREVEAFRVNAVNQRVRRRVFSGLMTGPRCHTGTHAVEIPIRIGRFCAKP